MKSMTGYGAAEGKVGRGKVFIEVRTVNHRYSDITLKVPPKLHVLDAALRREIQQTISRGKVELFLKEEEEVAPAPRVVLNVPLVQAYERALRTFERTFGKKGGHYDLLDVIDLRDCVRMKEPAVKYERLWREIRRVCRGALKQLDRMRGAEGAHIRRDQLQRLRCIVRHCGRIGQLADQNARQLKSALRTAAPTNGEHARNASESISAAIDRADVTEERIRFESHLAQYRTFLGRSGAIGRQLDFLIQEMNREVNTIASKSGDARVSQLVVEIKSELEKLREQAQNIE
ncbi:MAG: YicC family protein [Deltaproteobacteria bacterium]|nr:YicC family protein [Deltaproteobacteria bacterium]